ncbi:MAG TPA: GGDEF domain-containing protein [Anaerolineales bacterium]|nr:GGDEF domain-containing protein [Anaerolineales bacterium]
MELNLNRIFEALENGDPRRWTVMGIAMVGLLGTIDALIGREIVFSLFYLVPIVLVTLAVNKKMGMFTSFLSGLTLLAAEVIAGQKYSHPIIYVINMLIRTGFFMVVTYLVAELHKAQKEERLAARTDFVTGAVNARWFNELLKLEIERIRRYPHPFTVVFIDIDDFKLVNDLFGHQVGDQVLRSIAGELKSQLRKTDIVARVGGDEFALLLPSTQQPEAEVVLSKVHAYLREAMKERNWPVTFSMGAVTCVHPPYAAEQLINLADELMYTVKRSTKNDVRFITWGGDKSHRYMHSLS